MGEDRLVEQVLQAGMVVAIQVAILEHLFAGIAVRVQVLFEYNLALSKRPCLVGAQHVHRPEVLDSIQPFDDHSLPPNARAPLERLTVTIMGSISGVSPTATAIANRIASNQSCLLSPLIRKTAGTITAMKPIISQVNLLTPLSKLVSWRCPTILAARDPK